MAEVFTRLPRPATLCTSSLGKEVWVQNPQLLEFVENAVTSAQLKKLADMLQPTLHIPLTKDGFVQAANRNESADDPTHYDAVWVRDSVWIYHAFAGVGQYDQAVRVLQALLRYFSTPHQLGRLNKVIAMPSCVQGPAGAMEVLHIRFDSKSPTLQDIHVNGEPQYWNHKQNDALGIFYLAVAESLSQKWLAPTQVPSEAWEFLLKLPTYFEAIAYFDMPDAGAWEELERINTSSIALVTDALEKWQALRSRADIQALMQQAAEASGGKIEDHSLYNDERLTGLIDHGYRRLFAQLPHESPLHPQESLQFRKADAALLNLLYPCRLSRLDAEMKLQVLSTVESLAGQRGIRRYFNDAYQSGNYWIKDTADAGLKGSDAWTDDCSRPEDFEKRTSHMISGTEAQWFFDSWFSFAAGLLKKELGPQHRAYAELHFKQLHYLHRALGQITGGAASHPEIGGDLRPVAAWACPESYNTLILRDGNHRFAPSPITPLNWAKASLRLALRALE